MPEVIVRRMEVRKNESEIQKLSDFLDKILTKEFCDKDKKYKVIVAIPGHGLDHPFLPNQLKLLFIRKRVNDSKNGLDGEVILVLRNDPNDFVRIILYDSSFLKYLKKRLKIYKGDTVCIDVVPLFD